MKVQNTLDCFFQETSFFTKIILLEDPYPSDFHIATQLINL